MSRRLQRVFLWVLLSLLPVCPGQGADSYLMGEDAVCFGNLVLTVNQLERRAFQGGMGIKGKRDVVEVQVTLVNSGKMPVTIEPTSDFILRLDNTYSPEAEAGKNGLEKPFTIHPQGQSRGLLFFHVPQEEKTLNPKIIFNRGSSPVTIYCDKNLSIWLEKSANQTLELASALELGQFLIEAGRVVEAEKVVQSQLQKYSDNTVLLMQMATIKRLQGKMDESSGFLNQLSQKGNLSKEDSLEVAKESFNDGNFELTAKLLEPLGEQGRLDDKGLLMLARTWYFTNELDRAEKLLRDLDERGINDKQLYFSLGNIADKKSDPDNAQKWWEKTLNVDPNHFEAMFNIGVVYYKKGDQSKAAECWGKVLNMNPDAETRKIAEDAIKSVRGGQ